MAFLKSSRGFIALGVLPYALGAIVVCGLAVGLYFKGYANGSASRNDEIAQMLATLESARAEAKRLEAKAGEAAKNVRVEYRKVIETVTVEKEAARELVEVIRRDASCDLPPAYRQLWDGKPTSGSAADSGAAGVNGAPVAMADAAAAVAEAKEAFELNKAKLEAIQSFLRQIEDAPLPK